MPPAVNRTSRSSPGCPGRGIPRAKEEAAPRIARDGNNALHQEKGQLYLKKTKQQPLPSPSQVGGHEAWFLGLRG